ncbi:MAG: hypothetical protein ED559_02405 [Phycisphaera sp.]|nr:MAG: hypothetical protein ED559_02405 [Phycisphaera sp.]
MRICVSIVLFSIASIASADTDQIIRYEVDLAVRANTVSPQTSQELAALTVGTTATFTFDAIEDATVFPPDSSTVQVYPVLDVSFQSGSINVGAQPGVYPSTVFIQGAFVLDNANYVFGGLQDTVLVTPFLDHPDFGVTSLSLAQILDDGSNPTLIDGFDIPLSLDTSLLNTDDVFIINSTNGPSEQVRYEFVDLRIVQIPAPDTLAVLALGCLLARRRRR